MDTPTHKTKHSEDTGAEHPAPPDQTCDLPAIPNSNPKYAVTPTGIEFFGSLNLAEWDELGRTLNLLTKKSGFMLGDWINYGAKVHGEKYKEALEVTGIPPNAPQLCVRGPPGRPNPERTEPRPRAPRGRCKARIPRAEILARTGQGAQIDRSPPTQIDPTGSPRQ
jgi:hypothetical protein